MKKIYKYAKYMKYAIIFCIIMCTGILYSCNFKGNSSVSDKRPIETNAENKSSMTQAMLEPVSETETISNIYVFVCGRVNHPGVYSALLGTRAYQFIELAGGFCEDADVTYLNLAEGISDGQKLYVPAIGEALLEEASNVNLNQKQSNLININKATKEQLMTLPGIGETKAQDIINYRNTNGAFGTIEDIKNISGIKDSAFNKIKEFITV